MVALILNEITPDPSRIREVDFGPFKHKIDDGLDLRKAAYQVTYFRSALTALYTQTFQVPFS